MQSARLHQALIDLALTKEQQEAGIKVALLRFPFSCSPTSGVGQLRPVNRMGWVKSAVYQEWCNKRRGKVLRGGAVKWMQFWWVGDADGDEWMSASFASSRQMD